VNDALNLDSHGKTLCFRVLQMPIRAHRAAAQLRRIWPALQTPRRQQTANVLLSP
jgi:hypothetical protein